MARIRHRGSSETFGGHSRRVRHRPSLQNPAVARIAPIDAVGTRTALDQAKEERVIGSFPADVETDSKFELAIRRCLLLHGQEQPQSRQARDHQALHGWTSSLWLCRIG